MTEATRYTVPPGFDPGFWSGFVAELDRIREEVRLRRPGTLVAAMQSIRLQALYPLTWDALLLAAEPLPDDPGSFPRPSANDEVDELLARDHGRQVLTVSCANRPARDDAIEAAAFRAEATRSVTTEPYHGEATRMVQISASSYGGTGAALP